jgi:3-hydroxybutyryl-CoA dehydratase
MKIGESASFTKTLTEEDVRLFGQISGDDNPVHFDEAYAASTIFGRRVVHGMLSASLISTVLGTKLPGPGAIYAKQEIKFLAPVFIGDTLTATCTVKDFVEEKRRAVLECKVVNRDGKDVIAGEATVIVPK